MTRKILFALAVLLESAPLARYHSLRARGSDLYYVARYGRGRNRGAWFHGWPRITRSFDWGFSASAHFDAAGTNAASELVYETLRSWHSTRRYGRFRCSAWAPA